MKATIRVTRDSEAGASARHNDRSYKGDADPDDPNRYYIATTWGGLKDLPEGETFEEVERRFYAEHYTAGLEARNERAREKGHAERVQNIDGLYHAARTRPQQIILQIGDRNLHAGADDLRKCLDDFCWKIAGKYGDNLHILTAALHLDETTPHAQLSAVYDAPDKYGYTMPNQSAALKALGYSGPAEPTRRKNATVDFLADLRALWYEVCKGHGYEIDTTPRPHARHVKTADYITARLQADISTLEAERAAAAADLRAVREEVKAARDERCELEKEIDALKEERARIERELEENTAAGGLDLDEMLRRARIRAARHNDGRDDR